MSEHVPLVLKVVLREEPRALDAVTAEVQRRLDLLQVPVSASFEASRDAGRPRDLVEIDGTAIEFEGVSEFAEVCYRARELMITAPVVQAMWRKWSGESECPAPLVERFQRLLRDAVRWGFRLELLEPAAQQLRKGETDVALAFESAVAEVDTAVFVRVPPGAEEQASANAQASANELQETLFQQLGLYLHPPRVTVDPSLPAGELRVQCNDLLVSGDSLLDAIRAHAGAFMTARLTGFYVARLWRTYPRLVEELTGRFDERMLTRVLRHLLDEGVSIRDLWTITHALLHVSGTTSAEGLRNIIVQPPARFVYPVAAMTDPERLLADDYAECARIGLWRAITHAHQRDGRLAAYFVESVFEQKIAGTRGMLPAEDVRAFVGAVRAGIGEAERPLIVTRLEVRRHVRRLLERELPKVAVLSFQELGRDTAIDAIGRITPVNQTRERRMSRTIFR